VQWVPFEITTETLARPLINSALGMRNVVERGTRTLQALTGSSRNVPTDAADPNAASVVVVRTNLAGSDNNPIITAEGA
ncbi:hypothetical protein A2U01_0096603, partial [Trifolium medium]|nr:hypothetical protein [Trifolium medium]